MSDIGCCCESEGLSIWPDVEVSCACAVWALTADRAMAAIHLYLIPMRNPFLNQSRFFLSCISNQVSCHAPQWRDLSHPTVMKIYKEIEDATAIVVFHGTRRHTYAWSDSRKDLD